MGGLACLETRQLRISLFSLNSLRRNIIVRHSVHLGPIPLDVLMPKKEEEKRRHIAPLVGENYGSRDVTKEEKTRNAMIFFFCQLCNADSQRWPLSTNV